MSIFKKGKFLIFGLPIFIVIVLFSIYLFLPIVKVKATPAINCPNLGDLGYCIDTVDSDYSYYCGIKFNEQRNVTIRFAGDKVKIDNNGNAFFDYDEREILGTCELTTGGDFIVDRPPNCLIISDGAFRITGGKGNIIQNYDVQGFYDSANFDQVNDFVVKDNNNNPVTIFDASESKLYIKGNRIVNGDEVLSANIDDPAYEFLSTYAPDKINEPHYCKKSDDKFTLKYGCFIGSYDKDPGEKKPLTECSHCDPCINLFDWSDSDSYCGVGGECHSGQCTYNACDMEAYIPCEIYKVDKCETENVYMPCEIY